MNNYYTLRYLVRELNANLQGCCLQQAISFRKNIFDMFWAPKNSASKQEAPIKLTLSTHPGQTAVFTDPRASVKKSNVASFFESIRGYRIKSVDLAAQDRFIYINFWDDDIRIVLTPFGSSPNAFLLKEGRIADAFKHPDDLIGQTPPQPRPPQPVAFKETKGSLKRRIQRSFPLLPRPLLPDIIHHGDLEEKQDREIVDYLEKLTESLETQAHPRLLSSGQFTIIGSDFLPDPEAETFESVDEAIRIAYFTEFREHSFAQRQKKLRQRLDKLQHKYTKMLDAAMEADKSLQRAQRYEQLGSILMAHAHEDYTGSERITLPDLYNENREVEIELEPGLNLAANAQKYFERKKKSERSYEAALTYAEEVEQRLKVLNEIGEALDRAETARDLDELEQHFRDNELFSARGVDGQRESKPFKILKLGKYEVWIGKNAKSNDALLRASHKDDIWLHARSVTGSHVLIRMNKMQTDPDKHILETAASWAAWYSKAKGQELVPVICLRKKFVRKPKNAPAGTTVFDREEVIMAEPAAPPSHIMQDS